MDQLHFDPKFLLYVGTRWVKFTEKEGDTVKNKYAG